MSKSFRNTESILAEIGDMAKEEKDRREDRATVSAFYNGQPPFSDAEAKALGLGVNVNNLFGYDELSKAKGQLLSLYTKPVRFFEVQIDAAPPAMRQKWERIASQELNRVIKKSGRFRVPYEGACGDSTMHGEADFIHYNTTDWCPSHLPLSRRLVPSKASIEKRDLTHFAIESTIKISDAHHYIRHNCRGWKISALRSLLKDMSEQKGAGSNWIDNNNPESLEYARQASAEMDNLHRFEIPVYYFYQARHDKPGRPLDLTIIAKKQAFSSKDGTPSKDMVLFEGDCVHSSVERTFHPLFMATIIGGEMMWHRVLGLGHLNYNLSWHIEALMNRAMQAAYDGAMNFWQAADGTSPDEIERILLKHNGVIPSSMKLVQNRVATDFRGLMGLVQSFRQQGSRNAMGVTPNEGRAGDVLEVQAIAEQDQASAAKSGHLASWADYMSSLGKEIVGRFSNELIQPSDKGYSEILDFQSAMDRHGVPLHYLQPSNIRVSPASIAGNGDRQQAIAQAGFLQQNLSMYPPSAQQKVKRIITAAMTDNYELAEELIPFDDKPDSSQVLTAESENSIMLDRASMFIEQPLAVNDTDIPQVHIETHFGYLVGLIKRAATAQKNSFTPDQALGFRLIGGHAYTHIQTVEDMGDKQAAKQYTDTLNNIAAMGQKMANNMAQQQPKQPEVDPIQAAKIQLDAQKLELQREKSAFQEQKFERTQGHREQRGAMDELLKVESHEELKRNMRQQRELEDIRAAAKLKNRGSEA